MGRTASMTVRELSVEYAGPLPPPDLLARYGELHPDAVAVILRNFDEQSRHRRNMEAAVVTGSERRADRGQPLAAGLLALGIVSGSLVALVNGTAGVTIVGAAFTGGVLAYVVGGRPPRRGR